MTHPVGGVTIGSYGLEPCRAFREQERLTRVFKLQKRGMTFKAAAIVVDAAMFGDGCTEGRVREDQQRRIDAGENL